MNMPSGAQDPAQTQTKLGFEGLQRHLLHRSQTVNLMFINRFSELEVGFSACLFALGLFKQQMQAVVTCHLATLLHMQYSK